MDKLIAKLLIVTIHYMYFFDFLGKYYVKFEFSLDKLIFVCKK